MLSYSTTLLLAAACLLIHAGHSEFTVTTCEGDGVHRMSCESGVIDLQSALYGRENSDTCSAGVASEKLSNTACSLANVESTIKIRCDGRTVCELSPNDFSGNDPCSDTFKYLQTKHKCLPAHHLVACEGSFAHLHCDHGQVIRMHNANYGRHDQSTCTYKRPARQIENIQCSSLASKAVESCNRVDTCVIQASNSEFGDPCVGTYKYLQLAYFCEYPVDDLDET